MRLNDVIFLRFEAPWQMNYECYFIKLNKTRASKLFLRYFDELILISASNENEENHLFADILPFTCCKVLHPSCPLILFVSPTS